MSKPADRMRAIHPGEVLREDYLAPLGMSVHALAMELGVPATRLHEIVKERRSVSADTAERLARYFGGEKSISHIMPDQVRRFAEKAGLPVNQLWTIAQETSARIVDAWRDEGAKDSLPAALRKAIDRQIERAAI